MVLGLGRSASEAVSEVTSAVSGDEQSLREQGFWDTQLTTADFEGPLDDGDVTPTAGEWEMLNYYVVGDQESVVIGSKDAESEETGEVDIRLRDTNDNTVTGTKVRVGYETKNGRASNPVFTYPSDRLDQTDVDDRINQAPIRWGLMRDNDRRNGIAQSQDRITVKVHQDSATKIDSTNTEHNIAVMKSEE